MQTASFEVRYGTLYVLSRRRTLTGVYIRITIEGAGSEPTQVDLFSTDSLGGDSGFHLLSTDAGIRGHAIKQGIVYNGEPVFGGLWKSYDYGWISVGPSDVGPCEPFLDTGAECAGYYGYAGFPGLGNADEGVVWPDIFGGSECGHEELRIVGTEWRNPLTVNRVEFQGMVPNFCGVYKPMPGGSDDGANDIVLGNLVLEYDASRDIPYVQAGFGSGLAGGVDRLKIVTPVGGPSDSIDGAYAVENDGAIIALVGQTLATSASLTDRLRIVIGPGFEEVEDGEEAPPAIDVSVDAIEGGTAHVDCVLQENRLMTRVGSTPLPWQDSGIRFLPPEARAGTYAASVADSSDYTVFKNPNGFRLKKASNETVDGIQLDEFYKLYDGGGEPIAYTRSPLASASSAWGSSDGGIKLYQIVGTVVQVEELPETGEADRIYVLPSGARQRWLENPVTGAMEFMNADSVFEIVAGVYQETGSFGAILYRDIGYARYRVMGLTDWYPFHGVSHVALGAVWHRR